MTNHFLEISFKQSQLKASRFDCAKLTRCDFSNADLTNVSFRKCQLTEVNFNGATISGTNFTDTTFTTIQWGNTNFSFDNPPRLDWNRYSVDYVLQRLMVFAKQPILIDEQVTSSDKLTQNLIEIKNVVEAKNVVDWVILKMTDLSALEKLASAIEHDPNLSYLTVEKCQHLKARLL